MRSWLVTGVLGLLVLAGCGGGGQTRSPADDNPANAAARVEAFERTEDELLRDLSALDRRVALRARVTPGEEDLRRVTMGAVLAEDPSLAAVDGAIDPFSFEARARGLASAKAKLATTPKELPSQASAMTPSPAFERELLGRLIDEETVRLDEERALPRSASALVRGVVETWTAPASKEQTAERDRWLTRRLEELRASVAATPQKLDVIRARELDDALDALEHEIDAPGFRDSTAKLVQLREALEAQNGQRPRAAHDWSQTAARVQAHLGLATTPEAMDAALDAAEKSLRARAEKAAEAAKLTGDDLGGRVAKLVFPENKGETPCVDAVPGSRLRSMVPPPERTSACRLRHTLAEASDEAANAAALVALHDHVVIAQWALDTARGGTIEATTAKHHTIARPSPDVTARWERIALARPVSALGGGYAAALLVRGDDPRARALAWSELGEVPLDVAERMLDMPLDAKAKAKN